MLYGDLRSHSAANSLLDDQINPLTGSLGELEGGVNCYGYMTSTRRSNAQSVRTRARTN